MKKTHRFESQARRAYLGTGKPAKKPRAKKDTTKPEDHFEDILAPHHFSEEEKAQLSIQLVNALDAVDTLQTQAKQAAQDFKLRITNEQNKSTMLRAKLNSGVETREMRARVEFEPKRKMKKYFHPETGDFVREESMQVADWQLPMFKPAADGKGEVVAPPNSSDVAEKGAGKPTKTSPKGETSVGDVLDSAAAMTNVSPILIAEFDREDWTSSGLTRAFKAGAKAAGWNEAQISVIKDRLKECDSVRAMRETLVPFLVKAESAD